MSRCRNDRAVTSRVLFLLMGILSLPGCSSFGPSVRHENLALPQQPVYGIESHEFETNKTADIIGQLATVPLEEGDTLLDIGRHYGLGYQEMADANPVMDPWTPPAGSRAILPLRFILPDAPRKGVVINLAAMRLFRYDGDKSGGVSTFPVGIGKEGRSSPVGAMSVSRKQPNPTWYVPESIRKDHERRGDPLPAVVSPGPDNPLGEYAMYLSKPSYLIHGTNKPYSIGFRASNGCIRLYPEDIAVLFREVREKTQVKIVNQPYLVGWLGDELYLEAHQPHEELDEKQVRSALTAKLKQIEKKKDRKIDWPKVEQALAQPRGIPLPIFENSPTLGEMTAQAVALDHPPKLYGQPQAVAANGSGWYIRAAEMKEQLQAEKLAAMLNHLGPRIPARAVEKDGRFVVLAGPFKDKKGTKTAAKQLKFDLEIVGDIIEPTERVSLR